MDELSATFRPGPFADKRVLVSGGTAGIGLAIARGFAALGAAVTATGSTTDRLDAARADPVNAPVRFKRLDVRDRAAVDAFVGACRLNVLVCDEETARSLLEETADE